MAKPDKLYAQPLLNSAAHSAGVCLVLGRYNMDSFPDFSCPKGDHDPYI